MPISSAHLSLKSNFTKGGIAKRVFKPTIPLARSGQQASTCSHSSLSSSLSSSSSSLSPSLSTHCIGEQTGSVANKLDKKKNSKVKKKLIQINPTFNGIDAKLVNQFKQEGTQNGTYFDVVKSNGVEEDIKIKVKTCDSLGEGNKLVIKREKENLIKETEFDEDFENRLYKDDFIKRDIDSGTHLPIGWEHLVNATARKECTANGWTKIETEDKGAKESLLMFQLPEMVLTKREGRVGKLRIYKSGKIELIDEESKLIYEIRSTKDVSSFDSPFATKPKTNPRDVKTVVCNLNQEAVALDGNQINCLGSIDTNDILIGYPKLNQILNQDT